jgi:hypothetical protein
MVMPQGWVKRSAFAASALLTLSTLTFVGCRTNPTNPFLEADADYDYPDKAGDPLAASLDKLRNRTKDLKDSAAQTADSAKQLRDDAAAIASDSASDVRQVAVATLDDAKTQGKQLAYDAAVGAKESAKGAANAAQLEAINSLEDLPLEQAGPVLLVAMSRGTPAMQKAASDQLARRWPPAAGYSASELAQQQRDAAMAQLEQRWAEQFGKVDEAVAAAQLQAAGAIDKATAVVDSAQGAVDAARSQVQDVRQLLTAYQQTDLPATARQELAKSLEQLSTSADTAVRIQAAQAMGKTGDPAFMPALMTMLNDGTEVQAAAIASLEQTTGRDVAKTADGRAITTEERARAWQLWYREQMDQASKQ